MNHNEYLTELAENARWMELLSAPYVLTEDETAELMALHSRYSDRDNPDARIDGRLDG